MLESSSRSAFLQALHFRPRKRQERLPLGYEPKELWQLRVLDLRNQIRFGVPGLEKSIKPDWQGRWSYQRCLLTRIGEMVPWLKQKG